MIRILLTTITTIPITIVQRSIRAIRMVEIRVIMAVEEVLMILVAVETLVVAVEISAAAILAAVILAVVETSVAEVISNL